MKVIIQDEFPRPFYVESIKTGLLLLQSRPKKLSFPFSRPNQVHQILNIIKQY